MRTQEILTSVVDWASQLAATAGPWTLAVLMFIENVFPPIPSEVILPLAGYRVATGDMGFGAALLASTAGSLVGAIVIYGFARLGGRRLVLRWGRLVGTKASSIESAERRFESHGSWLVLTGRMVPGVRSLVSLPAGLLRMPVGRFLALTALGTVGWNALLLGTGALLGDRWRQVTGVVDGLSTLTLAVLAVAALIACALLVRRRLAAR